MSYKNRPEIVEDKGETEEGVGMVLKKLVGREDRTLSSRSLVPDLTDIR
jgi:hypothetical protein